MNSPGETEGRRLAIVGSRAFKDPRMLADRMEPMKPGCVISGGADGADRLGIAWARRNGIETLEFKPQHKKYKHPYHHRNRLIAEACDVLVAFWNGRSSGTKYTIEYARRIGKPVIVIRF